MPTPRDQTTERWGSRVAWWGAFALVALVHLYFVPYFPALNNPNENARVYQVRSFVELGKLSVDEQIARYGMVNDLAVRDGKLYSGKAPGTTFLGVPVYAGLRAGLRALHKPEASPFQILLALRLATSILPTLAFLLLFRGFLRRMTRDGHLATMLTVVLALGTMMLPYALLYVNHSTSAACAFGTWIAADAAWRCRHHGRTTLCSAWWLAVAGFLGAFAVSLDYALAPVGAMALAAVVWWVRPRWPELSSLTMGALVPAVMTGVYHQICWGGPFRVSMSFLANPQFASNAEKGLFGIIGPTRESVWGVLLSPNKGLLFFSPVVVVGLVAVVLSALVSRRSKLAVLSFAVVAWMLLYGVSLVNWDAGWTVGPRYVTVILPFVVASIALLWRELGARGRAWLTTLTVGLGISSILAVVASSVTFPHLQPGFVNPLLDSIWPLWRDGITPRSAGRWLFHWQGRMDQAPVFVAVMLLIGYLVSVSGRAWRWGRWPWARVVAGGTLALALAAGSLEVMRLPRTDDPRVLEEGTAWLRTFVWEPKLPPPPRVPLPRRPMPIRR